MVKIFVIVVVFWFFVGIVCVNFEKILVMMRMFFFLFDVGLSRVKLMVNIFNGLNVSRFLIGGFIEGSGVLEIRYFLYFL